MIRQRLNVRFLLVTAAVVGLLAVMTSALHALQMRRHARNQLARADRAESAGQNKTAAEALGRSLAFDPNNTDARTRHAWLLADQADTPRSRQQALAALLALLPAGGGSLDLRLRAVDLALSVGAPGDAIKLLRPAIEAHPDRADLYEKLGQAQEAAGKFPAAAESLEKALELQPDRVASAELLSRLYRSNLDQTRRAAGVLDRLVNRNPRLPAAYLARGKDRMEAGKLDQAAADLAQARKLDANADVLAASAELARRRGQGEESVRLWERASVLLPDSPAIALGLTRARRDQGDTLAAVEAATEGLAKHPDDVDLNFTLAGLLIDKGDLNEAVKRTDKLPAFAKGKKLYLQGRLALAQKQPAVALRALYQASAAPDLPAGMAALALVRAYGDLGHHHEQLLTAQEAVRLADSPRSRVELARVLVSAGRGREALKELTEVAALPSPPEATWVALARALFEQNVERAPALRKWDEVDRALARADQVKADQATAAVLRAEMLTFRERPDEALKALRKARSKRPDEPSLYQAEAALLARRGEAEAGQKLLDEADNRFGDRLDWMTFRALRLVRDHGADAAAALEKLEQTSHNLTAEDRERLAKTLASLHSRIGNYAAVERLCAEALRADPNDLQAALLLFDAELGQRAVAGAEKALATARKIEGTDGVAWRVGRATLLLGRDATARAEARTLLEQATAARPRWTHPLLLLARLDEMEHKPADALANYQRVLALGDYDPTAVRRAVTLLLARGRDDDADRILEQAERVGALDVDLIRPAAEIALNAGRPDRAVRLARLGLTEREPTPRDLLWLGNVLAGAGRGVEAETAFLQAAVRAPHLADAWLGLIAQRHRNGQKDEAEEALDLMRRHVPAEQGAVALARAYEILGRRDEAEKAYRRFLDDQPRDAKALRRLAALYVRQYEMDKAEGVLLSLLDSRVQIQEEQLPEIRRRLVLVVTAPGRKDRSKQALALLAANKELEGDAEADRRVAALVRGANEAERAAAIKELEAMPGGPAVTQLERLRLARLYEAAGRWADARKQYAAALTADKDNPAYVTLLIEALLRQKKKAEAAGWVAKLEKLEPNSPRTKKLREQTRKTEG